MTTLILAFLLLSGYIFVTNSKAAWYKFRRLDGWGAYFFVAMWGGVFTVASWSLCSLLSILGFFRWAFGWAMNHQLIDKNLVDRLFPLAPSATLKFVDMKFALFGLVAIALAWIWPVIFIKLYKLMRWGRFYNFRELEKVIRNRPEDMMLMMASVTKQPVLVTMGSRKFYVGIVADSPTGEDDAKYLALVPLLSGYRHKDTLVTNVTTNYWAHYRESGILDSSSESGLGLEDFKIAISMDEIDSISNFDLEAYGKFKANEERDSALSLVQDTDKADA